MNKEDEQSIRIENGYMTIDIIQADGRIRRNDSSLRLDLIGIVHVFLSISLRLARAPLLWKTLTL